MWRTLAGLIALSPALTGADVPRPERVPAAPLGKVEETGRNALASFGAARLEFRRDDAVRSAKSFETAAKLDPSAAAPLRELASVYADLGRDAAAVRTARRVLELDPKDADTAHLLAKLLYSAKHYAEAARVLAGAVTSPALASRVTKSLALRLDLARCLDRAADAAASVAAWQAVREYLSTREDQLLREGFTRVELAREAANAAEKRGRALIRAKQYEAAAESFEWARDLYADPRRAADTAGAARIHANLAELAIARQDPPAAIRHLEAFLAFKPHDPAPYMSYGEQLRLAGRDAVAALRARSEPVAEWAMLAELSRTPAGFGEANPRFAEIAMETSDPAFFRLLVATYARSDSGSGLLRIAEMIFPPSADATKKGGRVVPPKDAARRRAFAAALVAEPDLAVKATRAARLSGGANRSPELWDVLAWACGRAGQPDVVESALRAAYQAQSSYGAFQRLQRHLYSRRKWQDILDLCAASRTIGGGVLNFYRAAPLAELGRADAALRALAGAEGDNAFASRREKIHVLDILGRHAEMLAECDAAMVEFRSTVEVHSLRYLRARALQGLDRSREAEDELRGLLEDDADDALALNNLGYNLAEQNRKLDDAERMIRRAIEIDSDDRARAGDATIEHAAYLDSLGWVLFRKGKWTEAREQLEKAAALPEGAVDPTVWDHLGDAAFRLGDRRRAKEAWTQAHEQYATTHLGRVAGRQDEVARKLKLVD